MGLLLIVVVLLLGLAVWWVSEVRKAWARPVPLPERRVPPRPAQLRRRTDASVADEAERIIRAEIARAQRDGVVVPDGR